MPKDDCFVPCSADALLNKDVVDVIDSRRDAKVPVRVNVKKVLNRRIEINSPV
ncbi:MAG: hypothetical protein RMJ15_01345 [Nitrososphaerota archaeon]|nr:hypothetical protein [Nitrososphaerota archaeon]